MSRERRDETVVMSTATAATEQRQWSLSARWTAWCCCCTIDLMFQWTTRIYVVWLVHRCICVLSVVCVRFCFFLFVFVCIVSFWVRNALLHYLVQSVFFFEQKKFEHVVVVVVDIKMSWDEHEHWTFRMALVDHLNEYHDITCNSQCTT